MSLENPDNDDATKGLQKIKAAELITPLAQLVKALLEPIGGKAPDDEFVEFAAQVLSLKDKLDCGRCMNPEIAISDPSVSRVVHLVVTSAAEEILMRSDDAPPCVMAHDTADATVVYAYAHQLAKKFTD